MPTRIFVSLALAASSLLLASPARAADPAVPVPARVAAAQAGLQARLGDEGVVTADPQTGTPAVVARTDGFLTAPTDDGPATAVLAYVRAHPDVFRLDAGDLDALTLVQRRTTADGITHLRWDQSYRGVPAIDSALEADVAPGGRIVNVTGAPRHGLVVPSTTPEVSAGDAEAAVGGEDPTSKLVIYEGATEPRLGWRVQSGSVDAVVDARTGAVVRRIDRADDLSANVTVYPNYPGAPGAGGVATTVDIGPWLTSSTKLIGPNVHAFLDPNDIVTSANGATDAGPGNEVQPLNWQRLPMTYANNHCPAVGCSWNPNLSQSWENNQEFEAVSLFYLVNVFHDHLLAAPISFTPASGNFEGADAIIAQAIDGANTGAGGLPNSSHLNNANFYTPPDGQPGRMQMYLWSSTGNGSISGTSDASVVYHEYTHGLSNRLITGAGGAGALTNKQPKALGEAWSDWYALDFLGQQGYLTDTATVGDVVVAPYAGHIRYNPLDCPVGTAAAACPGGTASGAGGFTYGDYGKIARDVNGNPVAEEHGDGEIWAETLWDLRRRLVADHGAVDGQQTAEQLVTSGMRLTPGEPTFLQARDAILQADTNLGGLDHEAIWQVFAARGMGAAATTTGAADTAPHEDFTLPAAGPATAASVKTSEASSPTTTGATLNALVNPHGTATTYRFELGTTTGYGTSTVPVSAGSATSAAAVTTAVTSLAPGTTYHVRVVATNSAGTTYGADKTFTTVALPPPSAPATSDPAPTPAPAPAPAPTPTQSPTPTPTAPADDPPPTEPKGQAKKDLVATDGPVTVTIKGAPKDARSASLVAAGKVIGTVTFTSDGKARVKLTAAGRKLVTKKGRVSATLKVRTKSGKAVTAPQPVTLRAARPRSAHR